MKPGSSKERILWGLPRNVRDVCPAKSRFLPQNRASQQATHAKKVRSPRCHGVALPGSALQFPGCFHSSAGRRTKGPRDQEWGNLPNRPGKVMAPHPTPPPHPLGSMSGAPTSARSPAWPTTEFPPISPGLPHPAQGAVPNISWAFPDPHLALGVTYTWETALCEHWVQGAACRPRAS